jgi:hypothetical protein
MIDISDLDFNISGFSDIEEAFGAYLEDKASAVEKMQIDQYKKHNSTAAELFNEITSSPIDEVSNIDSQWLENMSQTIDIPKIDGISNTVEIAENSKFNDIKQDSYGNIKKIKR